MVFLKESILCIFLYQVEEAFQHFLIFILIIIILFSHVWFGLEKYSPCCLLFEAARGMIVFVYFHFGKLAPALAYAMSWMRNFNTE